MGYSLIYTPVLHFDDINGRPLVGGKLYTYKSGTSTPAQTYRNANGTELNENPILLNERGECVCFLDDGLKYKFVLKDSLENTIWEQDNVSIPAGGGGGGGSYTAGTGIDIVNGVISRRVQLVTTSSSYAYVKSIIDAGDLPVLDIANGSMHDLYVCTMYRGSDIQFVGSSYGQTTLYNLASNNVWTSKILEPQITVGNAGRILAVNAAGTDAEWQSWVKVPSYAFADRGKLLKVVYEGGNLGLKWDQPNGYVPWQTDWASGYTHSHTVTADDVAAGYFDMYQAFAAGADTASAIFGPIRVNLVWDTRCTSGLTSNYVSSVDFAIGVDGGSFSDMFTDNAPAHEVHKDWYLYPNYLLHTRCNRIRIRYHLTENATAGTGFQNNVSGLVDQVR